MILFSISGTSQTITLKSTGLGKSITLLKFIMLTSAKKVRNGGNGPVPGLVKPTAFFNAFKGDKRSLMDQFVIRCSDEYGSYFNTTFYRSFKLVFIIELDGNLEIVDFISRYGNSDISS